MSATSTPSPAPALGVPRNRLLSALPPDEYARLAPHLEPVALDVKRVIFDVDQPIEYVHFPETSVVSVLGVMADGSAVEAATIGNEGMAGLPIFHGTDRTSAQAICQVPGAALRMPAEAFREEIGHSATLTRMLHLYSQALFTLLAQSSACNRIHTMTERCARWLLHTHDRVGGPERTCEFPLTHQFLSQMLGVRRATVTEAMGALHQAGAISYSMGRVTVVDRGRLERAACECYAIIQREFDRLLGAPARSRRTLPDPLGQVTLSEDGMSTVGDGTPRREEGES